MNRRRGFGVVLSALRRLPVKAVLAGATLTVGACAGLALSGLSFGSFVPLVFAVFAAGIGAGLTDQDDDGSDVSRTFVSVPVRPVPGKDKPAAPQTRPVAPAPSKPAAKVMEPVDLEAPDPMSRTVVFDPSQVEAMRAQVSRNLATAATSGPETVAGRPTTEFEKVEIEKMRVRAGSDETPEQQTPQPQEIAPNNQTMAYIPAYKVQDAAPPAPSADNDAYAPTQAYLPAFKVDDSGNETLAYTAEDRQKLLDAMMKSQPGKPEEVNRTMAYSVEDGKALREAYEALNQPQTAPQEVVPTSPVVQEEVQPAVAPQPAVQASVAPVAPVAGRDSEVFVAPTRPPVDTTSGSAVTGTAEAVAAMPASEMGTGAKVVIAIGLMLLCAGVTGGIIYGLLLAVGIPIDTIFAQF